MLISHCDCCRKPAADRPIGSAVWIKLGRRISALYTLFFDPFIDVERRVRCLPWSPAGLRQQLFAGPFGVDVDHVRPRVISLTMPAAFRGSCPSPATGWHTPP